MGLIRYGRIINKIFFHQLPSALTFFVTSRCNAHCKMCFYLNRPKDKPELTINEIEKISKGLGSLIWLLISGGEPFLREDLAEICQIFCKNNRVLNLQIPTNGILSDNIERETSQILKRCNAEKIIIVFSIDGIGRDHDFIREFDGAFERIKESIYRLSLLKRRFKKLAISACITVSSYNQDKLIDAYNYIEKELKIPNITTSLVRGIPREKDAANIDIGYYEKFHNFLLQKDSYTYYNFFFSKIAKMKDEMMRRSIIDIYKGLKDIIPCYAGSSFGVINEIGDVYPCELVDIKIGNLRKNNYDFKRIWYSKEAIDFRENLKRKGCGCTQECALTFSILLNPKLFLKILRKALY